MVTVPAAPAGLQAERTKLAWSRTALAVAVGSLGVLRFVTPHVGAAGIGLGVAGVVWALALTLVARRRHAGALAALAHEHLPAEHVPGAAVAMTAVMALVVGAGSLVAVVAMAVR